MLNYIVVMGRLTRDPELRYTKKDTPVASFTIACDRVSEGTDFIECVAWNKTAQFVDQYFKKGSMAVVEGRLQIRDWEDKNGNKRKTAEIMVNAVHFGESRKTERNLPDAPTKPVVTEVSDDGELPF